MPETVWIISAGTFTRLEPEIQKREGLPEEVQSFRTSDLGQYLLSPRPIQVTGTLVGCEVHRRGSLLSRIGSSLRRGDAEGGAGGRNGDAVEEWTLQGRIDVDDLNDARLTLHLGGIVEGLRPYNPLVRKLARLDMSTVTDLVGITEDLTGVRTRLVLKGSVEDKRCYLVDNIAREVPITLRNAYLADGLFEMRGYDFRDYQPMRSHRLLRYQSDGQSRAVFMGAAGRVDVHVPDMRRLRYVRIFEQAVRSDGEMAERLRECLRGEVRPLKLYFNDRLEIAYSNLQMPSPFQDLFLAREVRPSLREMVVHSLKRGQIGISLSYLPSGSAERGKTHATVSVMHDIRAFEALKREDPHFYREIQTRAGIRDAVPYYLLDSITGVSDETSL